MLAFNDLSGLRSFHVGRWQREDDPIPDQHEIDQAPHPVTGKALEQVIHERFAGYRARLFAR